MTRWNGGAPGRPRPPAAGDERGAIMVMGIFMCVFLVGALWYIAGIGDVVLYRERMQEASDAVAFSMATVMARGMNILVLLNLLMAAVESIRVAINLIMFATLLLAGINWAIGAALDAASYGTAGEPFIVLGTDLFEFEQNQEKNFHDQVSPRVDDALEALHDVEKGVWQMPKIAQVASLAVVDKYNPPLQNDLVGAAGIFISNGSTGVPLAETTLPVTWGTTHKLCMKAFDAVKGVLNALLAGAGTVIVGPVEALADAVGASDFFCELGDSGDSPDMSSQIQSIGQSQCDGNTDIQNQCTTAASDRQAVNQLAARCPGGGGQSPDCQNLPSMEENATSEQNTCDSMKQKCADGVAKGTQEDKQGKIQNPDDKSQSADTKKQSQDQSQNQNQNQNQNQDDNGNSDDKRPTKVDHDNWWNGGDKAQILAIEYSDGKDVTFSPKFVRYASQNGVDMADPDTSKGQTLVASQAEFFYDCHGAWDDKSCDKDEEALWNFHWRARFRLVNPSAFGATGYPVYWPEFMYLGKIAKQVAHDAEHPTWSTVSPARLQFAIDYANATIPPMTLVIH